MYRRPMSALGGAVLTVACAATIAGCGGSSSNGGSSGSGSASGSPSATSSSGSASGSESGSSGASGDTAAGGDVAKKISDAGKTIKSYHLTMASAAGGKSSVTEADTDVPGKKMALTMKGGPMAMKMTYVGGFAYVQMPGATPKGKYMKLSDAQLKAQSGTSPADSFSIEKQTSFLAAVKKVEDQGEQTVDGEKMHKYRMSVDSKKVLAAMKGELPKGAAAPKLPPVLQYDVWVDGQNRMRKSVSTLNGAKTTTTISKIDEPVKVAAPPAAQVVTKS